MNITDIIVRKTFNDDKLKAIVSIVLENSIAIHDIKVIRGNDTLFVAMPARKREDGIYKDIIHLSNPETRTYFEKTILDFYENYIAFESVMNSVH